MPCYLPEPQPTPVVRDAEKRKGWGSIYLGRGFQNNSAIYGGVDALECSRASALIHFCRMSFSSATFLIEFPFFFGTFGTLK